MSLEEICANCGETQDSFEVKSFEDITYLVSKCTVCEYENRVKTNDILQITTF